MPRRGKGKAVATQPLKIQAESCSSPENPELLTPVPGVRVANYPTGIELNLVENMADADQNPDHRPLQEYTTPSLGALHRSIKRPTVAANNFEIKPATIQLIQNNVQFGGLAHEDPNDHIMNFEEMCDTFKQNGVSEDAIRLRLFPFSLNGKAKNWLNSLAAGSISTWEDLAQKFLSKYFPPAKIAQLRNDITSFKQHDDEPLDAAWERFGDLLRRCPHHGLPKWLEVHTFFNGLTRSTKISINAAAGGKFAIKGADEAYELLEWMATGVVELEQDRVTQDKKAGIHEISEISALRAQVATLSKKFDRCMMQQQAPQPVQAVQSYEYCGVCGGGDHYTDNCPSIVESVNYLGNVDKNQNNPHLNTINPGWQNHHNFSWGNNSFGSSSSAPIQRPNHPQGFNAPQRPQFQQVPIETPPPPPQKPSLEDMFAQYMQSTDAMMQSQAASIKALENQVGQLTNEIKNRPSGSLHNGIDSNPKSMGTEHCKMIELRSGKNIDGNPRTAEYEKKVKEESRQLNQQKSMPTSEKVQVSTPPVPFPQRLQKKKLDTQFEKFLEVFKKLHINIPFAEALEQMPSYVKFMKDVLSKKRRLGDYETVALTEECSAILQKKLPPKLKDPGSFNIPIALGSKFSGHALCDLGASVNLMPLSVYNRLGLGEPMPTSVTLQLADRTLTYPKGVVEDVLVKVDKFIFPADFIVLDYEADKDVPIILGRPFLATGRTIIDVQKGELTMRVQDQEVKINVLQPIKFFDDNSEDCFRIDSEGDAIEARAKEQFLSSQHKDISAGIDRVDVKHKEQDNTVNSAPKVQAETPIGEPSQLRLKPLPSHLKYAYLGEDETSPIIISASLSESQESRLLRILRKSQSTQKWSVVDLKDISPPCCGHKITNDEDQSAVIEDEPAVGITIDKGGVKKKKDKDKYKPPWKARQEMKSPIVEDKFGGCSDTVQSMQNFTSSSSAIHPFEPP